MNLPLKIHRGAEAVFMRVCGVLDPATVNPVNLDALYLRAREHEVYPERGKHVRAGYGMGARDSLDSLEAHSNGRQD